MFLTVKTSSILIDPTQIISFIFDQMENKYRKETRYYCEMCKVFVYNNLAQKKKHELTPRHQNLIRRQLQNITQTSKQPVSKKRVATKIDISKYGIEGLDTERNESDFKVSKEFAENNQVTIGTTSIGEWEEVEEVDKVEAPITSINNTEEAKTSEMIGEEEEGFKLVEKKLKSEEVDDGEPLVFKKRTKKNPRK